MSAQENAQKSEGGNSAAKKKTVSKPKARRRRAARAAKVSKKSRRARQTRVAAKRRSYTGAERQRILATAQREGLTGAQVSKRFGISQVTYYLWRKRAGASSGHAKRAGTAARPDAGLEVHLRQTIRERMKSIVPDIVRKEVEAYLNQALGRGR